MTLVEIIAEEGVELFITRNGVMEPISLENADEKYLTFTTNENPDGYRIFGAELNGHKRVEHIYEETDCGSFGDESQHRVVCGGVLMLNKGEDNRYTARVAFISSAYAEQNRRMTGEEMKKTLGLFKGFFGRNFPGSRVQLVDDGMNVIMEL